MDNFTLNGQFLVVGFAKNGIFAAPVSFSET